MARTRPSALYLVRRWRVRPEKLAADADGLGGGCRATFAAAAQACRFTGPDLSWRELPGGEPPARFATVRTHPGPGRDIQRSTC